MISNLYLSETTPAAQSISIPIHFYTLAARIVSNGPYEDVRLDMLKSSLRAENEHKHVKHYYHNIYALIRSKI
jgi:hypothetical protein